MKLAKAYEPGRYEPNIYALWEAAAAFAPSPDTSNGTFGIVMPPPNANGNLHIGHALGTAIEDVMARYQRMLGRSTLFLPGADHAGFETWVVFERQLEAEGKTRFDYPREVLYDMVWKFVAQHRGGMELQTRQLGASVDWDNLTFTLDQHIIDRTYKTFKKMWDDGLIYRGKRLVNYCTRHHTAFADIEVTYSEQTSPLYYLKYGPFELATTRPETKFGDTAIAVHPNDLRYKQYVGKEIEVEGLNGPFKLRVIADDYVDPTFGTGVVKITPAHDFNDWDIAERHNLPAVQVIDLDGKLTAKAGRFAGLPVAEARKAVVVALQEKGLLIKVDEHYKNRVGQCYKCKTVIEPMLLDQWFVSVKPLAKRAIEALKANKITFTPKNKGAVLQKYYEGLRDWNISRQIPWGIPVPAFQNVDDPDDWIFDERVGEATLTKDGKTYQRDNDTFDTWFSSGQWPFATTKHLDGGALSQFYPNSAIDTGGDIMFMWVSRMIMLGLYCTDQVPFKHVYLHGLVLDEYGQKMSKSKGNVISPVELVEAYGSDALRMGLLANRSADVSQAFSLATVVAGRNFCNKLWNMARFIEDIVGDSYRERTPEPQSPADHWLLERLQQATGRVAKLIETYRFSEATEAVYHLIWDDIADWYIEAAKTAPNKPLLAYTLETILKLAHPFAPFVTETIWQTLKWEDGFVALAPWPTAETPYDAAKAAEFEALKALITEVRFVTAQLGSAKQALLYADDKLISTHSPLIAKLAKLRAVEQVAEPRGLRLALTNHQAWLDISDEDLKGHRKKLEDRLAECRSNTLKLEARLANPSYADNAPKAVVEQTRQQLASQQALEQQLTSELTVLE